MEKQFGFIKETFNSYMQEGFGVEMLQFGGNLKL